MNVCEYCDGLHIAGAHSRRCPEYAPAPRTRIEWFGSLQVHQPVKQSA